MEPIVVTSAVTWFVTIPSPIGPLTLTSSGSGLSGVHMAPHPVAARRSLLWREDSSLFDQATRQLAEYFGGTRRAFDVPLELTNGTPFQSEVWRALEKIPYGETISYGELARRVGRPTGGRSVGAAVGRNPWAVIVPCHRVIAANGELTGFGGGIERKRWLLEHEGLEIRGPRSDRRAKVLSALS
jgi:methylated-DNA-[protein]-cysteine S-methyltransferase